MAVIRSIATRFPLHGGDELQKRARTPRRLHALLAGDPSTPPCGLVDDFTLPAASQMPAEDRLEAAPCARTGDPSRRATTTPRASIPARRAHRAALGLHERGGERRFARTRSAAAFGITREGADLRERPLPAKTTALDAYSASRWGCASAALDAAARAVCPSQCTSSNASFSTHAATRIMASAVASSTRAVSRRGTARARRTRRRARVGHRPACALRLPRPARAARVPAPLRVAPCASTPARSRRCGQLQTRRSGSRERSARLGGAPRDAAAGA